MCHKNVILLLHFFQPFKNIKAILSLQATFGQQAVELADRGLNQSHYIRIIIQRLKETKYILKSIAI